MPLIWKKETKTKQTANYKQEKSAEMKKEGEKHFQKKKNSCNYCIHKEERSYCMYNNNSWHVQSTFYGRDTAPSAFTAAYWVFTITLHEVDGIIIPILQLKKLNHITCKHVVRCHTAG